MDFARLFYSSSFKGSGFFKINENLYKFNYELGKNVFYHYNKIIKEHLKYS